MSVLVVEESADGVTFEVRVAPRSARAEVRGISDGALRVSLTAPPVDGAANAALIGLLAALLGVPRRAVEIRTGERSKRKAVRIRGLPASEVQARLTPR